MTRTIKYLIATTIIIFGIGALVIFGIEDVNSKIQAGVIGGLIVSFMSYGIVLCSKNYFAEKHNASINQHKANCLSTFNTFVDSADDERKAAVLLQATQTIFSHQRSGYLKNDTESQSPSPIIEVIRKINPTDG